jgi:hypothetical protein
VSWWALSQLRQARWEGSSTIGRSGWVGIAP